MARAKRGGSRSAGRGTRSRRVSPFKFTATERYYAKGRGRKRLPRSAFLLPSRRKFPYRTASGAVSCRMLKAAVTRAAQHGYPTVRAKAKRLYQRYCARKAA